MEVKLSWSECFMAAQIGTLRHIQALRSNKPDSHGFDGENGWTVHIEGAAGEIAAAKALNKYWGGTVNTFKSQGDVGNIEVRTRSKSYYELIVRDNDDDNSIFVLVTGIAPNYKIVGWILAKDAKQEKWKKTHGGRPPAYFVPHDELKDISLIQN